MSPVEVKSTKWNQELPFQHHHCCNHIWMSGHQNLKTPAPRTNVQEPIFMDESTEILSIDSNDGFDYAEKSRSDSHSKL